MAKRTLSNKLFNGEKKLLEKEIQQQRGKTLLNDLATEKAKNVDIYTTFVKAVEL